jgi:hypothetical protein
MQLPASFLRNLEAYDASRYLVQLPPGYVYEDIFRAVFWAHHAKLRKFDIIRVIAHDWSFDVNVTVIAKTKGGANVQLTPLLPPHPGEIERKAVPKLKNGKMAIRVEYLKATNWRIIALDQSEHSRDYPTKGEAEKAMADYVAELGMCFVNDGDPTDDDLERMTAPEKAA